MKVVIKVPMKVVIKVPMKVVIKVVIKLILGNKVYYGIGFTIVV